MGLTAAQNAALEDTLAGLKALPADQRTPWLDERGMNTLESVTCFLGHGWVRGDGLGSWIELLMKRRIALERKPDHQITASFAAPTFRPQATRPAR